MLELGQSMLEDDFYKKSPYQKLTVIYNQRINYHGSKKGVLIRTFGGVIFADDKTNKSINYFNLSGNIDYTFDKAFFQRYDMNSTQFHLTDGAFKSNTFTQNFRTMFALNIKAPIPAKLPIGVFADVAYTYTGLFKISGADYYDAGVYLPIVTNMIEVYFPLYTSNYNSLFNGQNPKFYEQIRFTIDFPVIQPLNLIRTIKIF
jgi:hypothetical protein